MIKDDVMVYHVISRDVRNMLHVRSVDKCIKGKGILVASQDNIIHRLFLSNT